MRQNILTLNNISKTFEGLKAVKSLSFSVKKNSITGLIGPNGAGKTTAFNCLTHFLPRDQGEIFWHQESLKKISPHKVVKKGIARTFQQVKLFSDLTVRENLLLANSHKYDPWWKSFSKIDETKENEAILKALKKLDLEKFIDQKASDLSYGQSKLVEILRAILTDAELICLDEPASGINPTRLKTIEKIIHDLKKKGKTILIIEHNMPFLMEISDEIIVMENGKFCCQDTPKKIQKNPQVLKAYLGEETI